MEISICKIRINTSEKWVTVSCDKDGNFYRRQQKILGDVADRASSNFI